MSEQLTVKEVARLLRFTPAGLWRLIRDGKFPAVRTGRTITVPRAQLEQYLHDNRTDQ